MTYKRIRELREDHDLTQKYMAHYLNVIQRTYSRYERGERIIPPDVLCKIADFYNGAWSPTNAKSSMWTSCYQQIANCNLYLDEFTGLTFSEYELISDYKGEMYRYNNYQYEVRFLRAYYYFNLVRQYGDVPFTDHVLTTAEVNSLERRPAKEIFDFIISECDEIKDLIIENYENLGDWEPSNEARETGRANKRTVLALKARAALYAASPLFNPTNDRNLWHRAAVANKELIDNCVAANMSLINDYSALWSATSHRTALSELIFGRRATRTTNSFEGYNFPVGLENCNGGNCPTQTLVDAYEMQATGLRPDETNGYDPAQPYYEGRDPRFYLTIAKNGDENWPSWNDTPLQIYQGGVNAEPLSGATPTGYYLKKYCQAAIDLRASTSSADYHTWITFRLGEFYLNYAEAIYRYLGAAGATDNEFRMSACAAINKVRQRSDVQMPDFPDNISNTEFWERYKKERMVELAFEQHRFWDVRRWKEGGFTKIGRMQITQKEDGNFLYERTNKSLVWDDKMYFFPIPASEMRKNPNLSQNPGW